jgi:hypothetical protein
VILGQAVYGAPHRLSIDTPADLEFMRRVHDELAASGRRFALPEAIALLTEQPELRQINAHVHQRALVEHHRQVIFAVDAGGEFGFGHLMRCLEIATQVIERLGWPATFVVDHVQALELLCSAGIRVKWGAFARSPRGATPGGTAEFDRAARVHADLAIVDVSVGRPLPLQCESLRQWGTKTVFLDREDGLAAEADLIVYPGLSGRRQATTGAPPRVLHGVEYVIVRREVARRRERGMEKDIDVLTYLHDEQQRLAVDELAQRYGWITARAGKFGEFGELLSRARVFVSGFGQAFYEAVALATVPVAWPLSLNHAKDAEAFFDALNMPRMLVETTDDLASVFLTVLKGRHVDLPRLDDGTPSIVSQLQRLFPE